MKIAYIAEFDVFSNDGVGRKINQQMESWINEGMEVQGFFISHSAGNKNSLPEHMNVYFSSFMNCETGFFKKQLNRMISIHALSDELKKYSPDVIYYRQNAWFPGLRKVLKTAPVVMEVNTNDLEEIKLFGKMKAFLYRFGRDKILDHIDGIVAVSYEIEKLFENISIPKYVIANGYDFSQCKKNSLTSRGTNEINIVFVGSPNLPWHGVDHYVEMAKMFPNYVFHLVGLKSMEKSENLIEHGWLDKESLFALYKDMDIAVSTLGLYRKGMKEASPLKSREYACFGLPMIVGYVDTDLDGENFVLNIGNYDRAVSEHEEEIVQFIKKWSKRSINIENVKNKLDYKYKEKHRLSFMKMVLDKNEKN